MSTVTTDRPAAETDLPTTGVIPFEITRVFDAPRQLVWHAWTDPQQMAKWGGIRVLSGEVRPGSRLHYVQAGPGGGEMWGIVDYREVSAPGRIVQVQSFADADGNIAVHPMSATWPRRMLSTVTFAETDGRTSMTVRWVPLDPTDAERTTFDAAHDALRGGWTAMLDAFAGHLVTAQRDAGVSADEQAVRALIGKWQRALEAKDLDGLVADYLPDALLYDVKPPYKIQGPAAIREMWAQCLPFFPLSFRSQHHDLQLHVGGDLAFCHGLHRVEATDDPNHPAGQSFIRVTACYRKVDGQWKVAHEHVSIPFNCMTGQPAPITPADVAAV